MAPPVDRLVACPSCGCHAKLNEIDCPHCGAALRAKGDTMQRTRAAILAGLAVAAVPVLGTSCDDGETTATTQGTGGFGGQTVGGAYGGGPTVGGFGGDPSAGGFGGDISVGGAYGGGPTVGGGGAGGDGGTGGAGGT